MLACAHEEAKNAGERAYVAALRADAAVRRGRIAEAFRRSALRPHDVPYFLAERLLWCGRPGEAVLRLEGYEPEAGPGSCALQIRPRVRTYLATATLFARSPDTDPSALLRALREEGLAALRLLLGPPTAAPLDLESDAPELTAALALSWDHSRAAEAEAATRAVPLSTAKRKAARGAVLARAGRLEEGMALLAETHPLVAHTPDNLAAVGVLLAEGALRKNRPLEAESGLERSFPSAEGAQALGEILLRFGRPKDAVLPLRRWALADLAESQRADALQNLGWALLYSDNPFLHPEVDRISRQVPLATAEAKVLRAAALGALERFDEGAPLLEEAYAQVQASPLRAALIGLMLSQSYIERGKPGPARALIEKWEVAFPRTASFRRASLEAPARPGRGSRRGDSRTETERGQ